MSTHNARFYVEIRIMSYFLGLKIILSWALQQVQVYEYTFNDFIVLSLCYRNVFLLVG